MPPRLSPCRITAYTTTTAAGPGKAALLDPALRQDGACEPTTSAPSPLADLDRPRRRPRVERAAQAASPPGTAATTGSPGSGLHGRRLHRRGRTLRASATARLASRSCSAPRPPSIGATEDAYRALGSGRRAFRRTSARPASCTRRIRSARFVQRGAGPRRVRASPSRPPARRAPRCSPSAERLLRLGLADAADGRRRRHAVRQRAVRLQRRCELVSPEPCRPFDAGAQRHQPRRGRRLRAARARAAARPATASPCSATANPATRTTCRRRIPKACGAERALDDALARAGVDAERDRLHQPARHRQPQERRGRGGAGGAALPGAHPRELDQGLHRPHARARRASSRPSISLLAIEHRPAAGHGRHAARLDPACGPQIRIAAGARRGCASRSAIPSASAATTASLVFGRRRARMTRRNDPTLVPVEGIAFWAPTLPGWTSAARRVPRRQARRPIRLPSARRPQMLGAGRAPARARHASRWRSRSRARRCAASGRDAGDAARDLHLGARRPRRSTTTCARRSRPSRR